MAIGNVVEMSEVITFDAGDEPYLSWLARNPQGWILNVEREPKKSYLKLHRPWCYSISTPREPGAYTEREYMKICATRREHWRNGLGEGSADNWILAATATTTENSHVSVNAEAAAGDLFDVPYAACWA